MLLRALFLLLILSAIVQAQPVRPMVGKERTHVVAPGENLYTIAQQYSLAIEHIAWANRLPIGLNVAPGTKLLIPNRRILPENPPADGIVVNLPERGLYLFKGGQFDKFYPVAIGQGGRFATPLGSFSLVSRVVNPTWLPPEWAGLGKETIVPAGPDNPLGDRWMGLSTPGLGFHSTTSPMSIGQNASHGCMRMYPASAHELFDKVEVGMPVRIEYEPVKVGRDEETGALFLSVYPDVYNQIPLAGETQRVLDKAGLTELIPEPQTQKLIADRQGLPIQVVGTEVAVTVSGQPLSVTQAGLMAAGNLWLTGETARALGMELSYDGPLKMLTVRHAGNEAMFPVGDGAVLLDGKALFRARNLLEKFGIAFRWDAATRTLHIDS